MACHAPLHITAWNPVGSLTLMIFVQTTAAATIETKIYVTILAADGAQLL